MIARAVALATVLLTAGSSGCDDGSKTVAEEEEPCDEVAAQQTISTAGVVLALGTAKVFEKESPQGAVFLSADGKVSSEGGRHGTISADGTLTAPDGTVLLQVNADDSVLVRGQSSELELTPTGGTLTFEGTRSTLAFEEDGSISISPAETSLPTMAHEGCVGTMARTCALAAFATLATEVVGEPPAPAVPSPSPAPTN